MSNPELYLNPQFTNTAQQLDFNLSAEDTTANTRSKMLPIQRQTVFSSLRDDERDDAVCAANPRTRWEHHQTNKATVHHNAPLDRTSEYRRRYPSAPQVYPSWYKSSRWHSRGDTGNYVYQGRQNRPIGMIPVSQNRHTGSMIAERYRPAYQAAGSERYLPLYPSADTGVRMPSVENHRNSHHNALSNQQPGPPNTTISKGLVLPRGLVSQVTTGEQIPTSARKRRAEPNEADAPMKKAKAPEALEGNFDKLDLLCTATLELGPLQENPTGCSCPKSKCIALYCDCFKAGRRCSSSCTCLDCKNTVEESGPNGARSKAIQSILARNPRAFTNAGRSNPQKQNPGEQGCNCVRSRCLKLYCTCFQSGKPCDDSVCTCVGCLNVEEDPTGARIYAIQITLEKRPDAFRQKKKKRDVGAGCACKNNKCIRKYCECFRTQRKCTKSCSCRDCQNQDDAAEST